MKKVALFVSDNRWRDNNIFNPNGSLNRDNICHEWICLKDEFNAHGYDLSTDDINPTDSSDFIIYSDMPNKLPNTKDIHRSFLILKESAVIKPDNLDFTKHKFFNKIFTWQDDLVDNIKYFKLNFAHKIPEKINKELSQKEKLCAVISGNKQVNHPLELYSERIRAIRWFEENHPKEFDLYGVGWNQYKINRPKALRPLNKIPYFKTALSKLKNQHYPSYQGMVENKNITLQKYKFSICYENAKNIPGYITEKIFDCLFAGCIPIYLGANNIDSHIPKNCYIDKRQFDNYENLYEHIKNLQDHQLSKYLNNIEDFLNSPKVEPFSGEGAAKQVVSTMLGIESN